MFYGIPMRIDEVDGCTAYCNGCGEEGEISLELMEDEPVAAGDFVIVHAGFAIRRLNPEDALRVLEMADDE